MVRSPQREFFPIGARRRRIYLLKLIVGALDGAE